MLTGVDAPVWHRLNPTSQDSALALAAALVVFGTALLERAAATPLVLAGLSAAVSAPLVLRRRFPLTSATACAAVALGGIAAAGWSGGLVAAVALGSAAYHRPGRTGSALAVSVLCFLAPLVVGVSGDGAPPTAKPVAGIGTTPLTQSVLMGIAPVAVGCALRLQRERARQAARVRRAEAERVLAEERALVAREVHDAVGHHLTAIRMQAGAARHVLGDAAAVAGRVLATIDDSASTALHEVRALLGALRDNDSAVLGEVEALAARLSTPTCAIVVEREGRGPLPALVDHGAYRLVQEALTNAVRHSGGGRISVRVRQSAREVVIAVEDDGPTGPPPRPEGQGIRGMRERARLLGGNLVIAGRQPHGWVVRATLPL